MATGDTVMLKGTVTYEYNKKGKEKFYITPCYEHTTRDGKFAYANVVQKNGIPKEDEAKLIKISANGIEITFTTSDNYEGKRVLRNAALSQTPVLFHLKVKENGSNATNPAKPTKPTITNFWVPAP